MTTTVIYSNSTDGYIQSNDAVYATARAGASLLAADTGTTVSVLGQRLSADYTVQEAFQAYDTSVIGDTDTVTAVVPSLWVSSDQSATDFTLQARTYDWGAGLTTADWIAGADLGALTLLGTLATSGVTAAAYNNLTENGTNFQSWVNKTGTSYLVLCSQNQVDNVAPTGNEYLQVRQTEQAGTTNDPKITITHTPPEAQLLPSGIASEEAFGTAMVSHLINPSAIAGAEAFGTAALQPGNVNVSPSGGASEESFGTASVTYLINPSGIAGAEAFGTAALQPGNVNISPDGIASAEAFGTATLGLYLLASAIASAEAFGTPLITLVISPSAIAGAEAFGTLSFTLGAVNVSPDGIGSAEAFGAANLQQLIAAVAIASLEAFGTAELQPGPVSVSPSGIASGVAFGTAVITLLIAPSGIASLEAFGTATLTPGNVNISPSGIASLESFTVTARITGGTLIDHWASVREGDILKALLCYADFTVVCVLVRVIKRTYSDTGDGLLQLEVQLVPPFALTEDLTFIADTGPIPGPKAILPVATDVPLQLQAVTTEISKAQAALGLLQTS